MKLFENKSYENMDKVSAKKEKWGKETEKEEDENCLLDKKRPKKSLIKIMKKKVTNEFEFVTKTFQSKEFSVSNPVRTPKNSTFTITDPKRVKKSVQIPTFSPAFSTFSVLQNE